MIIKQLILSKCVRLMYSGIDYFEINPQSPYQLIVGTNGSGKSTILAQLSPLPATRQDFLAGGYKKITIEHNGHTYVLTNDFSNGNKHYFECDGELLLDGGNQTLQKDLVLEHFNYDQALHDVITADKRSLFSNMSPTQRRDWISRITETDISYTLPLFQDITKAVRYASNVRDHNEKRLSVEYNNVVKPEELNELKARIDNLTTEITQMMGMLNSNALPLPTAVSQLSERLTELENLSRDKILRVDAEFLKTGKDVDTLIDDTEHYRRLVENKEQRLRDRRKDYSALEDVMAQVNEADNHEENLRTELKQIEERLRRDFLGKYEFSYVDCDYRVLLNKVLHIEDAVISGLLSLPANRGRYFNRQTLTENQKELDNDIMRRNVLNTQLDKVSRFIEVIQTSEHNECPKCGYKWIPGVSDTDLERNIQTRDEILKQITEVSQSLEKHRSYVEECQEYWRLYMVVMNQITSFPELSSLQQALLADDLIFDNPGAALQLFQRWLTELKILAKRFDIEEREFNIKNSLERIEAIRKGGTSEVYAKQLKSLENEIQELTGEVIEYKRVHADYVKRQSVALALTEAKDELTELVKEVRTALLNKVESIRNTEVSAELSTRQQQLAQLVQQLTEKSSARQVVESLERSRDESLDNEKHLKILANELSPKTGLVADQLSQGIDDTVEQINHFINSVWTYEVLVEPCEVGDGDLDYKFPVRIKQYEKRSPDVSKVSVGQTDIINFAFIMTSYVFLELENYPLGLDELGATFDPIHRQRIVNFMKTLVETGKVSQIFYVSHNPEAYTSLVHADVCVLDSQNVNAVEGCNQHVVIK